MLSFRASAHTGVGIPRLEGKRVDKHPEGRGDCHTRKADWFAMTPFFQLLTTFSDVFACFNY